MHLIIVRFWHSLTIVYLNSLAKYFCGFIGSNNKECHYDMGVLMDKVMFRVHHRLANICIRIIVLFIYTILI